MMEFLITLLMTMPVWCVGAWLLVRRYSRSTALAGLEIKEMGETVRLRSTPRRTIGVVLLVLGVAPCFVLAGAMYDAIQGRPAWSIRYIWTGIIAVTLVAGLISGVRVAMGEGEMVFDHAGKVLRWRRRLIPFDQIARVEVRRHETSDGEDGTHITYAVWVVLKKDAEVLWLDVSLGKEDQDVARRLADLVARQLGVRAVSETGEVPGLDEARNEA